MFWLPTYRFGEFKERRSRDVGIQHSLGKQAACYERLLGTVLGFMSVAEANHNVVD